MTVLTGQFFGQLNEVHSRISNV